MQWDEGSDQHLPGIPGLLSTEIKADPHCSVPLTSHSDGFGSGNSEEKIVSVAVSTHNREMFGNGRSILFSDCNC